ncbi:MAG: glycosyltransferase family 4 protein [Thermoanaerobaculia bacterium]|jgi:glycosyltransferase involved in cell wall biosynthesis
MSGRPLLVVVQNKPTQFDGPLYRLIRREAPFDLHVCFTEAESQASGAVDLEIGRAPSWDHLVDDAGSGEWISYVPGVAARALAQQIAAKHPQLTILCGYFPSVHLRLALELKAKRLRIGLRSDNTLRHSSFAGVKGVIKRLVLPRLLGSYDSWHPVGTLARQYLEKVSSRVRPSFLFPYNVDNAWFEQRAEGFRKEGTRERAAMGFGSGDFVVLGVLKWNDREDPLTLVDGFLRFARTRPQAKLILVGDGPLREEIRVRLEGATDRVHLPGYVSYSELPRYYAVADVFVHPAPGEPWGCSVNEAMACGVPVIAAEGVGAGADLIVDGETGYVFPDRHAELLAGRLVQVCEDGERRMGRAASVKISEWSYQQTVSEMLRALSIPSTRGSR